MRQDRAIPLVQGAFSDESREAQDALIWTIRRVLPRRTEAVDVLSDAPAGPMVLGIHECVLYRFELGRGDDQANRVTYTVTALRGDRGRVEASVVYRRDNWGGPIAETTWRFAFAEDDRLEFKTDHPVYSNPEGLEEIARLIADAMGRPAGGQPSDR